MFFVAGIFPVAGKFPNQVARPRDNAFRVLAIALGHERFARNFGRLSSRALFSSQSESSGGIFKVNVCTVLW
jgi:hypothetical protein